MSPYLGLLPRVLIDLDCQGQTHQLAWSRGAITTLDHADPEGERMLAALGGQPSRCIAILDAWHRHAHDLRVLTLTSRGPGDRLDVPPDDAITLGGARHSSGGTTSRIVTTGGRRTRTFSSSSSVVMSGWSTSRGATHDDDVIDVSDLLSLPGGLPDRLAAGVLAHWTGRVSAGDATKDWPALVAALFGRAAPAAREWAGAAEPVQVTMLGPLEAPALRRSQDGLHLDLPFRWLTQVWAPGFSITAGRFVLDATLEQGQVSLLAADPEGGPASTMTLQLPR